MAVQYACRLAWIAFATASLHGLLAGSDFQGALWSALIAAAAFYGIGLAFGDLARRLIEEHVEAELAREETANASPPT